MEYLERRQGELKYISTTPPRLDFEGKDYKEYKVEKDKLIINQSHINWVFIILGGFGSFFLIEIFSASFYQTNGLWNNDFPDMLTNAFMIMFTLSFVIMFFQGFLGYKRVFIFDRLKGTFTYPEMVWFCSKTVPFDDVCFRILSAPDGKYSSKSNSFLTFRCSIGIFHRFIYSCESTRSSQYQLLSLFVWYMDKNRPLPPGEKFDPFRQEDYDRRQSQGFPRPLYLSSLDMEANNSGYKPPRVKNNISRKKKRGGVKLK